MMYYLYVFTRYCIARRAKLKNQPTLGHSPGEAACPNVGLFVDSHTQKGILCVNGGEGCTYFLGVKAASDMELQPFVLFQKNGGNLKCGPPIDI